MFYLSLEKEVQTEEMVKSSLNLGKKAYVPVVDKKNRRLEISELSGMDIEFEIGAYGIREPGKKYRQIVSPKRINFVVVPGLDR